MRGRFRPQQQQQQSSHYQQQSQYGESSRRQVPQEQQPLQHSSNYAPAGAYTHPHSTFAQQQNQYTMPHTPDRDVVSRMDNGDVGVDDADIAAGKLSAAAMTNGAKTSSPRTHSTASTNTANTSHTKTLYYPPKSANSVMSLASMKDGASASGYAPSDLEFFEDLVSEPVLVLGVDISHLDRNTQFSVCAAGVFGFSLLYGYLQELISVKLCARQLGLFLAMIQFTGYTVLAFVLRNFVYAKQQRHLKRQKEEGGMRRNISFAKTTNKKNDGDDEEDFITIQDGAAATPTTPVELTVPLILYLGLSILRAIDLGCTNLAMQYINYPAKTLMKSSRVVFTMMFGVIISRKKYRWIDYFIVLAMVAGLALFMHADANSSAVFDLSGVLMLTVSLLCDGAISNVSETIMSKFGVGQDEFIFRMYSIALAAITLAAFVKGDFTEGFAWLFQPGTYDELDKPIDERSWTVSGKVTVMVLFSSMGFFGSSCSAAITKNFGALTMSITSTARKATTLFLSFFLFNNVCTFEHILGVGVFIAALLAKSLRRSRGGKKSLRERRQQRMVQKIKKQNPRRKIARQDSKSDSSVSDVSDIELAAANSVIEESNIPKVVHADKLRSRPAVASNNSSPTDAERNPLINTL
mmetsp:Transcript_22499/g.46887  ORF Transcript_22499/g.46887 Transcript_22499/m.46887 type:complete len:637 (-) Transcript_22499:420-2330(-)|eukprot:CAMPEP_0172475708 /NCGR_PEP_ID=MMETSP1065-20121228/70012_1 /TAXON_ID=265537 /ORGANISM="Amphiprora paludosa, Strain CCMP125" /LENGTH=636 /DNA_ID=CAMNT_0013233921 /DNA_START=326 /DNA_END=2236 /DNA_ORIENTATION=+